MVLISGSGTNLQAIIESINSGKVPAQINAVVSNVRDAYGLKRAAQAGIETQVLEHSAFATREDYDRALVDCIERYVPNLVVLAGFMRILGPQFVKRYPHQIINIHPSLLPKYRGLHTHERALRDGASIHGATVHFVTEALDDGPIIIQGAVAVHSNDTVDALQRRVQHEEHRIYPLAIRWFAQGQLSIHEGRVLLDGRTRSAQGLVAAHLNSPTVNPTLSID